MSRSFSKKLYKSKEWQSVRLVVIEMQYNICNRCDRPIEEVHHKTYLTPDNINNPEITLGIDNLEGLCRDCHFAEHKQDKGCMFDDEGNPIARR